MKLLKRQENIEWAPKPNEALLMAADDLPPLHLCTSAYVFAFNEGRLLMADLDRGIDIPGGHIDPGESPEEAVRREVLEETGAVIEKVILFAHQKIYVGGPKPDGYRYPYPDSYQLMYFAPMFELRHFTADEDSKGPVLIGRVQAQGVPWLQRNRELYEYALTLSG